MKRNHFAFTISIIALSAQFSIAQIQLTTQRLPAPCNGGSPGLVVKPSGGTGAYIFNWSNGATIDTLYYNVSGWYSVTVSDVNSSVSDSFYLNAHLNTAWSNSYFDNEFVNFGYGQATLPDGGLAVVGEIQYSAPFNARPILVKIAYYGTKQWQWIENENPFTTSGSFKDVAVLADGNLLAVGRHSNSGNAQDAYLVKFNASTGQVIWQKMLGGSQSEEAMSVAALPDGSSIVAAYSFSPDGDLPSNYGNSDIWVFKIDSQGNLLWSRNYGGSMEEQPTDIKVMPSGKIVVTGYTLSNDNDVTNLHGQQDGWLLWLDPEGGLLHQRTLGGSGFDNVTQMVPTPDGGLAVVGKSISSNGDFSQNHGGYDGYFAKLGADYGLQWLHSFGGSANDGFTGVTLAYGGFLLSGNLASNGTGLPPQLSPLGYDAWLAKTDDMGNPLWQEKLGFASQNESPKIEPAYGGGYFLSGWTIGNLVGTPPNGEPDIWAVKFNDGYGPDTHLGPDRTICKNTTVYLNAKDNACTNCTYLWNDGVTYPNRAVYIDQPTSFSVTVTDACGNTASDEVHLSTQQPPQVTVTGDDYSLCANTEITLSAAAPTCPECTFAWGNNATNPDTTVLAAYSRTYTVTVTDAIGCTTIASHHITVQAYGLSAYISKNTTCNGGTATATAVVSGGTGNYTFLWNNGQTTQTATGLGLGTYSVTISDGVCQTATTTSITSITNTSPPTVSIGPDLTVCEAATVTLTAAVTNCSVCQYKWSNGEVAQQISVNPSESTNYSVTVTNAGNCEATDEALVTFGFSAAVSVVSPETCLPTGAATVTPSGGSGNYSYLWSNGATGPSISNIADGDFTVTVSDGSCEVVKLVRVSAFDNLVPEWSRNLGTNASEIFTRTIKTADGGFLACGEYYYYTSQTTIQLSFLVKMDAAGNQQWRQLFGTDYILNKAVAVVELPTGEILVAGNNTTTSHLTKLSAGGGLIFDMYIPGSPGIITRDMLLLPDGNVLLIGASYSNQGVFSGNHGGADGFLMKIQPNGTVLSVKQFGGSANDSFYRCVPTSDGFIFAGNSNSNDGDLPMTLGADDGWLLRTDADFNILWSKKYGAVASDVLYDVAPLPDGGFVAGGYHPFNNYNANAWVLKVNAAGNILWNYHFNGEAARALLPNQNGKIWVGAATNSPLGGLGQYDALLSELDQNGALLQSHRFGGASADFAKTLLYGEDGGLVLAGYSQSSDGDLTGNNGSNDGWLLKFEGNQLPLVELGPDISLCEGATKMLHAEDPSCNACTYLWNDGSTLANRTVTPVAPTTYAVTVTDASGCSASDEVSVSLLPAPQTVIAVSGPAACSTDEVVLDASQPTCPGCTYLWSDGSTDSILTINPSSSTTYDLVVAAQNGCTVSVSAPVVVQTDDFSIKILPDEICGEGMGSVTAIASGGSGSYSFLWDNGSTDATLTGLSAGTYSVTVSDGTCEQTATADLDFIEKPRLDWDKVMVETETERAVDFIQTSDGGYLLLSTRKNAATDGIVTKVNATANVMWKKTFIGSNYDVIKSIVPTSDGGWLLGGHSQSADGDFPVNLGQNDIWFFKLKSTGQEEWAKTYGGTKNDFLDELKVLPDGTFLALCHSSSNDGDFPTNYGETDAWVIWLDAGGNMTQGHNYGGTKTEQAYNIMVSADNSFTLTGYSNSSDNDLTTNKGYSDAWILRCNANGTVEWSKSYGGTSSEYGTAVQVHPAGGYLVAAVSASHDGDISNSNGYYNGWLLRLNEAGELLWEKSYGGNEAEYFNFFQPLPNGNFLTGGATGSNADNPNPPSNFNYTDAWLLAVTPEGEEVWSSTFGILQGDELKKTIVFPDGGLAAFGEVYGSYASQYDLRLLHFAPPKKMANVLGPDTTICTNTPFVLSGNCDDCTYLWDDGSTGQTHIVTIAQATTVSVTVTNGSGCEAADDIFLRDYYLQAQMQTTPTQCYTPTGGAQVVLASGGTGQYSYLWSNGTSYASAGGLAAGNYTVTIDDGVCEIERTVEVKNTQVPLMEWEQAASPDDGRYLPDDTYLLVGQNGNQWFVQRRNADGEVLWTKNHGPDLDDISMKEAPGGGYIVQGKRGTVISFVGKITEDGDLLWGNSFNEEINDYRPLPDGGAIAVGTTGETAGDAWAIKLKPDGSVAWAWSDGGIYWDNVMAMDVLPDGSCLLACETNSPELPVTIGSSTYYNQGDVWLLKLDASGNMVWSRRAGGTKNDYARQITALPNGQILFVGSTSSDDFDATGNHGYSDGWVMKLSADGQTVWSKLYGGSGGDGLYKMLPTADGGFVFSANSSSFNGDLPSSANSTGDLWLFKIDSDGQILWGKVYDLGFYDNLSQMTELPDGRIFFTEYHSNCWGSSPCQGHTSSMGVFSAEGKMEWRKYLSHYEPSLNLSGSSRIRAGGQTADGYWMGGQFVYYNSSTSSAGSNAFIQKFQMDYAFPEVDLGSDQAICPGEQLQVNAGNPGLAFVWSTGQTAQNITVGSPGTYAVEVTASSGCMASDEIIIFPEAPGNCLVGNSQDQTLTADTSIYGLQGGISPPIMLQGNQGGKIDGDISPNPTSGLVTVSLYFPKDVIATYSVVDMLGKKVLSGAYNMVEGWNQFPMDLTGFGSGIYTVSMLGECGVWQRKVVKE